LNKKSSGAYADTVAFNVARNELEGALGDLGNYVNIVANAHPSRFIRLIRSLWRGSGLSPRGLPFSYRS
jgi:hypothetical protein